MSTIDLRDNHIDTSGCEHLAALLQKNQVLSMEFFICITEIFIQSLETLNLQGNFIDDQGAQHLAQGLHTNQVKLFFFLSSIHFHLI